jgi:hypothetical protein
MTDTPLIKRRVTGDRGAPRLTTHEVAKCIRERGGEPFTTQDIANCLLVCHPGEELARVEYSVRAAVFWLVERGKVIVVGEAIRKSPRCTHGYHVTLYREVPEPAVVDFSTLYKALGLMS